MIITSGIVRAVEGPPRRAMVSVTKPSVSAIILLSGVKVSQALSGKYGGGGCTGVRGHSRLFRPLVSF